MNGIYSSLTILCIVCCVIGLVLIVSGIHDLTDPEKSFTVKKNPEIFAMTEEHFSYIIFADNITM